MACGAVALSACTSQADLRKTELDELARVLPGNYRNPQQGLTILRLAAPLVGDDVYYVRETAANDARRVVSERVWSLGLAADARLYGAVYAFEEPDRWRGGAESPELFRALLMRDLRPLTACDLIWEKGQQGFSATAVSARCPQRWRLEGDALAFSDQAAGATPGVAERYFHLLRDGGTHW